jgi:hypothetical protein
LWLCHVPLLAQASPLAGNGLIRDRREVPLDPLDGIPEEDPNQGKGKGKAQGGRSACRLLVTPANDRDVADLRTAVAVIQRGPKSVGCPADTTPLRLRVSIDAKGLISAVERLSGDAKLGDSLARSLTGQHCQSTVTTPTKGVAQIQFRRQAK